jgi:hypothetical protein
MRRLAYFELILALLLCSGCAHYQFNEVEPKSEAIAITEHGDTVGTFESLQYTMRAVEGNLVIRIKNLASDSIDLLGNQSSAIDATGEAHPLRSQTIPPGAFIKVILPPPRPTVYDPGPNVGFGFGIIGRLDRGYGGDRFYGPDWYDVPRTLTLYDQGSNFYWDWKANSSVKVIFTYQRDGHPFHQEFTFFKQKL